MQGDYYRHLKAADGEQMNQPRSPTPAIAQDGGLGRPVHGVHLGILVLDTKFQRLPGDIANAQTWPFPVQFTVVRGVSPQRVIGGDPADYLPPFYRAIDEMVALGVDGITTSCGFLAATQKQLAAYSPIPIAATSLLQIPLVQALLPRGKRVGVVCTDTAKLTPDHFIGVDAPIDLPIAELPEHGVIRPNMRNGVTKVDYASQEAEVVDVVRRFLAENPEIGAIVAECANLGPYSATVARVLNIPVYDIVTLIDWFHAGLRPRRHYQQS